MPQLADPTAAGRGEALSSVPRKAGRVGRSARSERYRYSEWPDGSRELYDHDADPGENTNLASRPEHAATIADLERALAQAGATQPRAVPTPQPRTPARPLNVVLIVVDDLNTRVGAWGAPVKTPAIDRLAARGVRFDRAYAQVAMCSPSRVSMLTGWLPERTGVWQNEDPPRPPRAVPLQELFAAHGAVTAGIGKIYHSPADFHWEIPEAQLDESEEHPDVVEAGGPGASGDPAAELWLKAPGADADQPDGRRARRAASLVERQRARPFFLALGLVRPHRRWIAPARYFDLYPPDSIAVTPSPDGDLADVPAIAVKTQPQPLPGLPLLGREPPGLVRDARLRRQAIAAYQACVSFADAQVGLVLDALDRRDRWQDTVVVLVGDNGFHLGEHGGLLRKDTLFEEALRVPLVVAAPGLPHPGAVVRAPVELVDVYPTIVELAGLTPPADLDGQSLVPLLQNPDAPGRGVAVSYRRVQPPERGWTLRTERVRYTLWPDGSEELYDRRARTPESENLAARPDWSAEGPPAHPPRNARRPRAHCVQTQWGDSPGLGLRRFRRPRPCRLWAQLLEPPHQVGPRLQGHSPLERGDRRFGLARFRSHLRELPVPEPGIGQQLDVELQQYQSPRHVAALLRRVGHLRERHVAEVVGVVAVVPLAQLAKRTAAAVAPPLR